MSSPSIPLRRLSALVGFALALSTSAAHAQPGDSAFVQGSGMATLERMPEVLRVHVQLSGKGKSLTEALAALKDRREAVKSVLPTLGAAVDSIKFADPQVTRGEEQQKMNEMLAQRMGRTKRASPGEAAALPTTATASLTADWPLEATDVEQLLAKAFELQEKIKAADLGGAKEATKLSPEEEELQAEMQQMMSSNQQGPSPGEPQFTFVLKVTPEDKAKLTAEAFQKAKADAERLAAAAGAKLGKIGSLQSTVQSADTSGSYDNYGGNAYYYQMQRQQMQQAARGDGEDAGNEAVGITPGKVKMTVVVNAYFALD
jgi:hypothetical protein